MRGGQERVSVRGGGGEESVRRSGIGGLRPLVLVKTMLFIILDLRVDGLVRCSCHGMGVEVLLMEMVVRRRRNLSLFSSCQGWQVV